MLASRALRLAAACLAIACVTVVAVPPCRPGAEPPGAPAAATGLPSGTALDEAGYLAVADRLVARLGALWDEGLGRYESGSAGTVSQVNADLLLVHAAAASAGHSGAARDDARARAAARFLTSDEIWREAPQPGWLASAALPSMHPVFEAEVAEGLAAAHAARDALGLEPETVARIRAQLAAVTASPAWRWPSLVMNQLNWHAIMFAADAQVNGRGRALASNLGRQLARFTGEAAGDGGRPGNFGPGLRFHYQPARWPHARMNFDSPEYANIVLSFARFYGQARAAGMARPAGLPLLRDWVRRVLSGYWTHAGYLNWDTGLGFSRWHQRKKVGLAHAALIGVAAERELQPSPAWGAWAKWMLDQGLRDYVDHVERLRRFPAGLAYGVDVIPQSAGTATLTAARYAANAARAVQAGLGRRAASEPPALYAFDPDTGRLAVTTPAYNTAIVPINHRSMPYGGLDLARLFDARQQVAANIGGTGANTFGLTVTRGGRTALRTQYGGRERRVGVTPLTLVRAPRGAGVTARTRELRAYAGPFTDLRVRGRVSAHGFRATSAYRFTPRAIQGRWTVHGRGGTARVTFPSWGRDAEVVVELRDGRRVPLGTRAVRLALVRVLHVRSAGSGYRLSPHGQAGAAVRVIRVAPQSSQPDPGPTLEVLIGATPATFGATIAVDPS